MGVVMIETYFSELWRILLELSPPLLLGILLAGLLHVFLPTGFVHRQLSRPGLGSIVRASLVGVPMPLCSCGVLPTALGLRREGASNGATTAFLISTPQTGVDSILVSAAFLGWPFAIFKLVAAFLTGIFGGVLADRWTAGQPSPEPVIVAVEPVGFTNKLQESIRYGVVELLGAIDTWVLFGVLLAAAISTAVPPDYFQNLTWAQGLWGMLLMLAVAVPLYVCTTGSVPIAASLVAAGLPAGAALVFLMAGPATNIATLGAVFRVLGARVTAAYLGTVILMSIGFGLTFDFIITPAPADAHLHAAATGMGSASAVLVIALFGYLFWRRMRVRVQASSAEETAVDLTLEVEGMTCQHCVANVKKALEAIPGVSEANPDLGSGRVAIAGDALDVEALAGAVEQAGYKVTAR
jgi:uncharacterized membrane protein YraQ (UPF0718 family)/copper chaperone CopZ